MKIHQIAIAILVVSIVLLGSQMYIADLGTHYNSTADFTGLEDTEAHMNETVATSRELSGIIDNITTGNVGGFDLPYEFIRSGWTAGRVLIGSWNTLRYMGSESINTIGGTGIPLPSWLFGVLQAMLIITIVAILIYAFFKWNMSD